MGALYEDVERFFGDIFAAYGRILAKWPFCFIIASAVLSGLLGFEIDYVIEKVMNITDYEIVCARNDGQCAIDGMDSIRKWNRERSRVCGLSGANSDADDYLAITHKIGDCVDLAKALKIRFYLRRDNERILRDSKEWQKRFISLLNKLKSELNYTVVNYAATESLSIELNARVRVDLKKFAFTVLIMIVYTTMHMHYKLYYELNYSLLAILGSCGLLSVLEIPFADSCGVMPFLVLGVGVDDMFILMSGWRQTEITSSVDERIAQTLRSSAISVTITSLTDLLAFCIGATTPFYSVRCFCVYAGK
ncbi:DgyrCDS4024 [Dimorphilus gyrociliatus]|uniref:DgyrCDS4024 n=1 Tax=Dimorphilus gyrociliatus TaxID=2664684 RepID=A0A7I8VFN4_9ANNE|nr:DgyrCDS4024 [Dimorphilus gyrociliatus]